MNERDSAREFENIIPYFVLAGVMAITCFQHLLVAKFNTFSISIIEAALCSLLLFSGFRIRISKKVLAVFTIYIFITLIYFVFGFKELHYEKIKIVKNIINTTIKLYSFFILWDVFGNKKIDKISSKILTITIIIQGIYYIAYKLSNSFLKEFLRFNADKYVIQDANGRFQGSLAEPSYMGFWIGISIFLIVLYSDKRIKYILVVGLVYILFFDCKAKFAIIAFPIAVVCAVYIRAKNSAELKKKSYIFIIVMLWLISVGFAYSFARQFFEFVANNFGNSITYATRFFFIFAAFRESIIYPIGTGYGLNYEYFYKSCKDLLPIISNAGLDIKEIYQYAYVYGNEANFSSKETVSFILSSFGVIGFGVYIYKFKEMFQAKYSKQYICRALVAYIFMESFFTVNLFDIGMFPFFVLSIMVINSHLIRNEISDCLSERSHSET